MNYSLLHLTYREMRETFLRPRPLAIIALVALVLGLSGPFQTFEFLTLVPRLIYWSAMCALTFAAGQFVGGLVLHLVTQRNWATSWRILACAIAAGLAVWPVVMAINLVTFGPENYSGVAAGSLLAYCILIAGVVAAVSFLVVPSAPQKVAGGATPKIVSRLPLKLRGALVSLSVQDHYVEVVTGNGAGLVHFRLSDAMDECDGAEGLQIHRSHWVALAGVKHVFRREGKVFVETVRGDLLPVSRTYLPKIKELGLL